MSAARLFPATVLLSIVLLTPAVLAQPTAAPTASAAPAEPVVKTAVEAIDLLRTRSFEATLRPKMLELIQAAANAEPSNAQWQIGLAHLGMTRMYDMTLARDAGRKATQLAPDSAEAWACRGSTVFMSIQQADLTDKMSLADEGKDAYLKAVSLDKENIEARIGLTQFYIMAPGIVGGSYKKAREHANALKLIKGGEFRGQLILAQIEAEDDNYKKAATAYQDALKLASKEDEKLAVYAGHANMLLEKKDEPEEAIEYLLPKVEPLGEEGWKLRYLLGKAYQQDEQWSKAQIEYEHVLKAKSDARNTRFALGEVLRKQRKYAEAAAAFREFAKLLPSDDRTKKALEEAEDCESRK